MLKKTTTKKTTTHTKKPTSKHTNKEKLAKRNIFVMGCVYMGVIWCVCVGGGGTIGL